MLNWDKVLRYVKDNLSFPDTYIEDDDKEIIRYLQENSHISFSQYFPDNEYATVYTDRDEHVVPGKRGYYYFFDKDGLDIFNIVEMYLPLENELLKGSPIISPFTLGSLKLFALSSLQSSLINQVTDFTYVYEFQPPNIIRLYEGITIFQGSRYFAINYERVQPYDLSRIPISLERDFKDLCLADYMIKLGNLRTMYQNIPTPFGEVSLNGEMLKSDGREKRERVLEKLQEGSLPPLIIDIQ